MPMMRTGMDASTAAEGGNKAGDDERIFVVAEDDAAQHQFRPRAARARLCSPPRRLKFRAALCSGNGRSDKCTSTL